jgi:hypothetical protein
MYRGYAVVSGVKVPHDTRPHAFLTSEPFLLATIELGGISAEFDAMTRAVYDAQLQRSIETGTLVAVSEDSLSREPWFVYNTLWQAGVPWRCVSPGGRAYPTERTFSTKAALAWDAIYGDAYSVRLTAAARSLATPGGLAAGLYDSGGTNSVLNINTNAVVLEALLYKARGRRPFVGSRRGDSTQ